jgi:regulator of cell morphogenesis and NO signaling
MTPDPTLAAIVNADPRAARILERHQLDYCCGGGRSLEEACAARGIDPATVRAELDAEPEPQPADWATMDPDALVDHLEATHHRYLHDELPRLAALATKVADAHGDRHPELHDLRHAFAALRADLEPHLAKEEQVLFPMIRQLAEAAVAPSFHCGSLANPIGVMLLEHDRAGDLLAALRTITGDYRPPADGCRSYQELYRGLEALEADTHLHVHKENNVLFPAVLAMEAALDGSDGNVESPGSALSTTGPRSVVGRPGRSRALR